MHPSGQPRVVIPGFSPPPDGKSVLVNADGKSVVVFNVRGRLFAIGSKCTHMGGPLEKGQVGDRRVVCPWHGSEFDLETGKVLKGPAQTPVTAYRATVEPEGLVLEARPLASGASGDP